MSTAHRHDHHAAGAVDYTRAFASGIALNLGFVIVEYGYGVAAHSTALLADATHNLSDVAGPALAWGAARLAHRAPDARFTYGLSASTILAALGNVMLLLVACGGIGWQALRRFSHAVPVTGTTVMWVALLGVAVNDRASRHARGAFRRPLAQ